MTSDRTAARLGGLALILAAVLFMLAFGYLAQTFGYPEVLDQPAERVLPRLLALGATGRAVWAAYGLIPLLLLPAAAGAAAPALRRGPSATLRVAQAMALVAALSMTVGLLRWPSVHWTLARYWTEANADQRALLDVLFRGLNLYLGQYLGEFLGELALNTAFVLFSAHALRHGDLPRWVGITGVTAGLVGLVAMFRNVTPALGMVADLNNVLLPLWLVTWGTALVLRAARKDT